MKKLKIPYYKQKRDYSCGAAALRMVLASFEIKKTEEELLKALQTTSKKGTHSSAFAGAARGYRLNFATKKNASIADLKKYLKKGFGVIVGYFYEPEDTGHYAVVKNISKTTVYLLDPTLGPNHSYSILEFKKLWLKGFKHERGKRWFFALTRS